jgi:hypothetical protein
MRMGPRADLQQTGEQRLAVAALIEILDVHHLETGCLHHRGVRKRGIRWQACLCHQLVNNRMGVAAATLVQNSAVAPNRKVRPLEVFTSIRFA